MRRLLPLLPLAVLVACGDKDDAVDTDTQPEVTQTCADPVDPWPMTAGRWRTTIDAELFNNCENSAGQGLHIHVGEDTFMEVQVDGACLDIQAEEMPMQGFTDGQQFVVEGYFTFDIGTCTIGVPATMTGTMVDITHFTYRMDAGAVVDSEFSPDACSLIVGDTENHTFPALPCDQAWEGEGFWEG